MKGAVTLGIYFAIGITGAAFGQSTDYVKAPIGTWAPGAMPPVPMVGVDKQARGCRTTP